MLDTRANSEEKLVPPDPLPHISRKALKRVKDPFPKPCGCRYCGSDVHLVKNSEVYGRLYGDWPFMYLCTGCRAYVGLHPNTDIPLGSLADGALRKARSDSKAVFYSLLEKLGIPRGEGYKRLAVRMNKDPSECHFGMFELEDCRLAKEICETFLNKKQ